MAIHHQIHLTRFDTINTTCCHQILLSCPSKNNFGMLIALCRLFLAKLCHSQNELNPIAKLLVRYGKSWQTNYFYEYRKESMGFLVKSLMDDPCLRGNSHQLGNMTTFVNTIKLTFSLLFLKIVGPLLPDFACRFSLRKKEPPKIIPLLAF